MSTGVTTVDCQKQVRSWRLLRSLIHLLTPTCTNFTTRNNVQEDQDNHAIANIISNQISPSSFSSSQFTTSTTTITGTIFGYRKGKINFCIQSNSNVITPILLLELAVPTRILAREMRGGTLRIALESSNNNNNNGKNRTRSCTNNNLLLSTPFWTMYCNGKKVGYAIKRRPSKNDVEVLNLMRSVVVGTGVIKCNGENGDDDDDEVMYLRGSFKRVGGGECESFHFIDSDEDHNNIHQELSIFFFNSK